MDQTKTICGYADPIPTQRPHADAADRQEAAGHHHGQPPITGKVGQQQAGE